MKARKLSCCYQQIRCAVRPLIGWRNYALTKGVLPRIILTIESQNRSAAKCQIQFVTKSDSEYFVSLCNEKGRIGALLSNEHSTNINQIHYGHLQAVLSYKFGDYRFSPPSPSTGQEQFNQKIKIRSLNLTKLKEERFVYTILFWKYTEIRYLFRLSLRYFVIIFMLTQDFF